MVYAFGKVQISAHTIVSEGTVSAGLRLPLPSLSSVAFWLPSPGSRFLSDCRGVGVGKIVVPYMDGSWFLASHENWELFVFCLFSPAPAYRKEALIRAVWTL